MRVSKEIINIYAIIINFMTYKAYFCHKLMVLSSFFDVKLAGIRWESAWCENSEWVVSFLTIVGQFIPYPSFLQLYYNLSRIIMSCLIYTTNNNKIYHSVFYYYYYWLNYTNTLKFYHTRDLNLKYKIKKHNFISVPIVKCSLILGKHQ